METSSRKNSRRSRRGPLPTRASQVPRRGRGDTARLGWRHAFHLSDRSLKPSMPSAATGGGVSPFRPRPIKLPTRRNPRIASGMNHKMDESPSSASGPSVVAGASVASGASVGAGASVPPGASVAPGASVPPGASVRTRCPGDIRILDRAGGKCQGCQHYKCSKSGRAEFHLIPLVDGSKNENLQQLARVAPLRPGCCRVPTATLGAVRGCSSMAERELPKLKTRVRFPSPARSMGSLNIHERMRPANGDVPLAARPVRLNRIEFPSETPTPRVRGATT